MQPDLQNLNYENICNYYSELKDLTIINDTRQKEEILELIKLIQNNYANIQEETKKIDVSRHILFQPFEYEIIKLLHRLCNLKATSSNVSLCSSFLCKLGYRVYSEDYGYSRLRFKFGSIKRELLKTNKERVKRKTKTKRSKERDNILIRNDNDNDFSTENYDPFVQLQGLVDTTPYSTSDEPTVQSGNSISGITTDVSDYPVYPGTSQFEGVTDNDNDNDNNIDNSIYFDQGLLPKDIKSYWMEV